MAAMIGGGECGAADGGETVGAVSIVVEVIKEMDNGR